MPYTVCTACFHITDPSRGTTQRCLCEPQMPVSYGDVDCPSGFHLCYICARSLTGGISRWSWNACERCRSVNSSIQKRFGFSVMLGRHSIMNGVSIPLAVKAKELDSAVAGMLDFAKSVTGISDWGNLQTRQLFESVPEWAQKKLISIHEWEKKFKSNRQTSLEAFRSYFGVTYLSEILKK